MSHSRKISAAFQNASYEQDGKYTKYEFKIQTVFARWNIEKRYSDFEKLHKELFKIKGEETLPDLPSKIYWNKNSEMNVSKRSSDLEKYLNELIGSVLFYSRGPLLEFIGINDDVLSLLKKTQSYFDSGVNINPLKATFLTNEPSYQSKASSDYTDSCSVQNNLYSNIFCFNQRTSSKNKGMLLVIENFLRDLEEFKENQGEIVRTFKSFLDEHLKEHQYSTKEIILLFTGVKRKDVLYTKFKSEDCLNMNSNNSSLKGLLYHIGNYTENMLGSTACLEFLLRLLSCDKNYDYDRYISVLKSLDNKYLKSMKLNEVTKARHLPIRRGGYQLFNILLNYQFEIEKLFNYSDYINLLEVINQKEF